MYLTHKHAAITSEIIPLLYCPLELYYHFAGTYTSKGQKVFTAEKCKKHIKIVAVDTAEWKICCEYPQEYTVALLKDELTLKTFKWIK